MFFGLSEITDHPCCQMQEVVEQFFSNAIEESHFGVELFPDWFRGTLNDRRSNLDTVFQNVHRLLHEANVDLRRAIYAQVVAQNRIPELCEGTEPVPEECLDWGGALGIAIKELMDRLYDSLDFSVFKRPGSTAKPRKVLYDEFIQRNRYVCPFCGLDKYRNRLGPRRDDFDHYLCKDTYPLAAANMHNLVPTCSKCNQDFKHMKNILEDGAAFYPYSDVPRVMVQVDCAAYPAVDRLDDRGIWSVSVELVEPDAAMAPKMSAWERVYSISSRLQDEIAEFFEEWMEEISSEVELSAEEFRNQLEAARNRAIRNSERKMQPGQIIRAAFYDFMLNRAEPSFLFSFQRRFNEMLVN